LVPGQLRKQILGALAYVDLITGQISRRSYGRYGFTLNSVSWRIARDKAFPETIVDTYAASHGVGRKGMVV
jgi:hypothetical protein